MLTRRPARTSRDEGFTLVELVLSVAILGLVMTAICGAMVVGLRTTTEADNRVGASNDVQFASTWFADDVASANEVLESGFTSCGSYSDIVVQFLNRDHDAPTARPTAAPSPTPVPVSLTITYALRTVTATDGTFRELHRVACTGGNVTDDVVARRLSATASTPTPSVSGKTVQLTLNPGDADAAPFTLRGTRRAS